MKPIRFLLAVVALGVALLSIVAVSTASAGNKNPIPPPPPDTRKLIKSVDVTAGTLVILNMRDKSLHNYAIYELTAITVNNLKGTIADIKPGMEVDNFMERDDTTLDSISLSGSGTTDADKTKKKK